jgi:uncharacterized protein YbjT (DUF2867 family)
MSDTTRKFLIVGATGKQGGSVIDALLSKSSTSTTLFEIIALTRNKQSSSAQSLASKSSVSVVEGDLNKSSDIFAKTGPIDSIFCMTLPGNAGDEEKQATNLIDAALTNNVKHFVFTSVDRGGPDVSERTPTNIPHFASKHHVEEYLKEKSAGSESGMGWTILRPVAFMDNLVPGFVGRAFAAWWKQVGEKKLQLIAARDIGHFGATALLEPEKYKGRAIGLAGDELNYEEACAIFKEVEGYDMPTTFSWVGSALKLALKEMGTMFEWFRTDGYGVDIQALRKEYPELQDFRTWLKESSKFQPK